MKKYRIRGGIPLVGEVNISGAKNAAVAILPAVALADGICRIENLPDIEDVATVLEILRALGAEVRRVSPSTVEINPCTIDTETVPYDLARHMRGSYYFLGSLLGRFRRARVPLPGGCDFGERPIDQHLKGFTALGAVQAPLENATVALSAEKLVGNSIYMDKVSVGATANVMMAACKARGITIIENAAKEPHIVDLANFLNFLGADISGAGTDTVKIRGVDRLHGTNYSIIPDQIEAGTYMAAAVATGGDVLVRGIIPKHMESISAKLREMGAEIEEYDDALRIFRKEPLRHCNVKTMPHPGFPTDMQPQIGVLLSIAEGRSVLNEDVYDKRFRYLDELRRMGAQVEVDGKIAVFQGIDRLRADTVKAVDLRAGAAMIIAGLVADGVTEVEDIRHIERGYENVVEKFRALGADMELVEV
ncbi:MAG: UDP-N-acetylglucosamine 1-carboxyvinyltransferase [Ruminococcaceae bacterium]|nr:UDP-N-acetylglucosamine 1-carboxyvinyltransferase [Oscillospiraceae bacterium]